MEKFTHIDEKNKVCVVVLKNEWREPIAKGVARCSEDDTFDPEAGLALANARAWDKYFTLALKEEARDLKCCEGVIETWNVALNRHKKNIEILTEKSTTIKKEIEDLLSKL